MLTVAGIRLFVGVVGQLGGNRALWTDLGTPHGSVHVDIACPWQGRTTFPLFFEG